MGVVPRAPSGRGALLGKSLDPALVRSRRYGALVAQRRWVRRLTYGLVLAFGSAVIMAPGASPATTVLGGTAIQIQAAPWTVFVQQNAGATLYLCTGSIVDASHILTAAHCLFDDSGALTQPSTLSIRAGISNFTSPAATDAEQDRTVTSFRVHPGFTYTGSEAPDDVAVLVLSSPLDLSGPAVQAVALPTAGSAYPAGAQVGVAGFGKQNPTADASGPLVWMTATIDAQGSCGQFSPQGLIENNAVTLCAVSPTSAVCNGDSGGGVVTTGGGAPVLVGVVDAGTPGCGIGTHSVFAYVGASAILSFVQGSNTPPSAPKETNATTLDLRWDPPLVVGNTLSCTTGGWGEPLQFSFSFVNTTSGQVLQSGPHATYVIPATAQGAKIDCEVAATNAGGTELIETDSTSRVGAPPHVRIAQLLPLAATRGSDVMVRLTLEAPAGVFGKIGVCATLAPSVGGHLCRSISNPSGAPVHAPFTLTFRVKPGAPLGASPVAISATAGLVSAKATVRLRVSAAA